MKTPCDISFESPTLNSSRAHLTLRVFPKNFQKKYGVEWYVKNDFLYKSADLNAFKLLDKKIKRTSAYYSGNLALKTPEHLAPVFLCWPSRYIQIFTEGEVPLLDGSALPFFLKLRKKLGVPEDLIFYDVPEKFSFDLKDENSTYGFVKITPAETFEVEYSLSRDFGFCDFCEAKIYSAEDLYPIFSARTFIFENEFYQAQKNGLLQGVTPQNGLLLNEKSSNTKIYRIKNEPTRHKILDLIGDLTFALPALPRVRIEIHNGGHVAHHKIMEKFIQYASFRYFTEI